MRHHKLASTALTLATKCYPCGRIYNCVCLGGYMSMCEYFRFLSTSELYFTVRLNKVPNPPFI